MKAVAGRFDLGMAQQQAAEARPCQRGATATFSTHIVGPRLELEHADQPTVQLEHPDSCSRTASA